MTKHDRAKLDLRLRRILYDDWNISEDIRTSFIAIVVREVDRAVRAERQRQQELRNVCHDCKDVLVNEGPVLCQDCLETRMTEGMDHDDMRTIQAWRKT